MLFVEARFFLFFAIVFGLVWTLRFGRLQVGSLRTGYTTGTMNFHLSPPHQSK